MTKKKAGDAYEKHKAAAGQRQRELSAKARDIGPMPPVVDHNRKRRGIKSLRAFCESYFPLKFNKPWALDHLKMIEALERATIYGGLGARAMPRGMGKTTLCEVDVIWALLTGRKRYVFLIGSSEAHALSCLANIKTELTHNPLLLEDFPEVCFPIKCLGEEARLAGGQTFCGEKTRIGWLADSLILPTIAGSKASGAIVKVAGITGNIRGALRTLKTGESLRPDLVILDDPQTDDSAKSESQNAQRESIIMGAVLGLAGPGATLSAIMPCTVIRPGDMVDRILDRTIHPEWRGERTKMVYSWPDRQDLWDRYAELRAESLRAGNEGEIATHFYAAHRREMDQGAVVSWPERHRPDELSGLQHAVNLKLRDPAAFASEYQNEPLLPPEAANKLTPEAVAAKLNNLGPGEIPRGAAWLTSFIDVHLNLLYWGVAAYSPDFSGALIAYGTWPEQDMREFRLADARRTLLDVTPGAGKEAAILAGLNALIAWLNGQTWLTEDHAPMRIAQGMVDAGWGEATDLVYDACKRSGRGLWLPSHGRGITASGTPIDAAKPKHGERVGLAYRIPPLAESARGIAHVVFDANFWKSFVDARWRVDAGLPGSLTLWGDNPHTHKTFSEHATAETPIETEGRGRRVEEWKLPPNKPDNHWGDVVVGTAVAAAIAGAKVVDVKPAHTRERKRVSYYERHPHKRRRAA